MGAVIAILLGVLAAGDAAPAQAPAGTPGLIAIFDLANLSSAVHLLTEDLGVRDGMGFRLLGRAAGAELRGCSLVVEELAAATSRAPRTGPPPEAPG